MNKKFWEWNSEIYVSTLLHLVNLKHPKIWKPLLLRHDIEKHYPASFVQETSVLTFKERSAYVYMYINLHEVYQSIKTLELSRTALQSKLCHTPATGP